MWKANRITRLLNLDIPLIQGPFGGGLSSVTLAATVSEAGGLGSFGAHHLAPGTIMETAAAIRQRTDRPFALNLWIPPHDPATPADVQHGTDLLAPYYRELGLAPPTFPDADYWPDYGAQVEAILEARPAVFSFVYGIPEPAILSACRQRGIRTLGTATVVAEARALELAGVEALDVMTEDTTGFRKGYQATEPIHATRQWVQKCFEERLPGAVTKIDLVKAYNRILWPAVWAACRRRQVSKAVTAALIREL